MACRCRRRVDRSYRRRPATSFGPHLTAAPGRAGHRGLSDARVTREGPTISDVYYHKSTRCGGGVAPAIVSGYKTCLRADPLHRSPITYSTRAAVQPLSRCIFELKVRAESAERVKVGSFSVSRSPLSTAGSGLQLKVLKSGYPKSVR